jgi:hypothetical protein
VLFVLLMLHMIQGGARRANCEDMGALLEGAVVSMFLSLAIAARVLEVARR